MVPIRAAGVLDGEPLLVAQQLPLGSLGEPQTEHVPGRSHLLHAALLCAARWLLSPPAGASWDSHYISQLSSQWDRLGFLDIARILCWHW